LAFLAPEVNSAILRCDRSEALTLRQLPKPLPFAWTILEAQKSRIADGRVCFVPIQIGVESGGGTADESERTSSARVRPLKITEPPTKVSGVSSQENFDSGSGTRDCIRHCG
jgi:hypothetical protein